MKRFIAVLVAVSFVAVAAPVFAQSQSESPKERFYKFDPEEIEGKRRGNAGDRIEGRKRIEFGPLSELKKDFSSKIHESSESAALQ